MMTRRERVAGYSRGSRGSGGESNVRGAVDYAKLAEAMKLPDQQFVTFAQTVGYTAS